MKITKRQLRQIIKEEKAKIVNEMYTGGYRDPKTGEDLFLKLNGIISQMLDMGMDSTELANELRGLADDVEDSGSGQQEELTPMGKGEWMSVGDIT